MRKRNLISSCNNYLIVALPGRKVCALFAAFLILSLTGFAQTRAIDGVVKNEKGELVPDVSVMVKGTRTGTATDAQGKFVIQAPQGKDTLVFTSMGYSPKEVLIGGQTSLDVLMQSTSATLSDVVVVAYGGSQKKATLSGAIASVKGQEVLKSPAINVSNSLSGRVAGLTVVGQGGEPGNDFSAIFVRGINTFKDATPLFVVDGIPLQGSDKLQRIDPSVIESITVLKDASAAIYGSQGANGVILVTTKRGKQGRVSVSASFDQGFSQPTQLPNLLNSYEIAVLQNEALEVDPTIPTPAWHTGKYTPYELAGYLRNDDPWHYANTDWMGEALKDWAPQNYVNVSLSGGSEKIRGLVSMSSRYQDGFYNNGSGQYNQYDVRANMDINPSPYILFSMDLNTRMDKTNYAVQDAGTIFYQTVGAPPSRRAYWPDGTLGQTTDPTGQSGSPVAISTPLAGYNRGNNYVVNGSAKLNIKIPWVEGLSVTGTGTIDRYFFYGKYWAIPVVYHEWDGVSTTEPNFIPVVQGEVKRRLTQTENTTKNYLFNFLVNYEKKFDNSTLKLLYGYEQYERSAEVLAITRTGFDADVLDQLRFGSTVNELINQSNPGATRWQNHLGRVNYDYKSKIFAEFVFRYQGSSIFYQSNRWGFFPGGSLAYRISEEDFWKEHLGGVVNSLKLRASWGQTGNDLVSPFQYLSLYRIGDNPNYVEQIGPDGSLIESSTLQESLAASQDVTWEKAEQLDIGFDAEFLKHKLSVTADYFRNYRYDILTPVSGGLPGSTGIIPPDQNIGKFLNHGFDFLIGYKGSSRKLRYQISLNGLYAKNKYLFFDEPAGSPEYQQQTGHPIGAGKYYEVIGIYHTDADLSKYPVGLNGAQPVLGDMIFKDVDGNGEINDRDQVRSDKSGIPTLSGGLTVDLEYQGFDLSVLFQGASGAVRYLRPTFALSGNYLQAFYDKRWTPDNPNADFPRVFSGPSAYWSTPEGVFNTFFLRKTDYARLKNVVLGYTLPPSLTGKINIERVRVYVSGLNLFTIAPDLDDFDTDPEEIVRDQFYGESYPLQRIINFGINVNF